MLELEERVVCTVGRFGWLSAGQLLRDFWPVLSLRQKYRRLARLVEAGDLLCDFVVGVGRVYRASEAGLAAVGLDLQPARRPGVGLYHALQVYDVARALTCGDLTKWTTERELRSAEVRRLGRLAFEGRCPDGVLDGGVAVELQRTQVGSSDYDSIVQAYESQTRWRRVLFVVRTAHLAQSVLAAIERVGGRRTQASQVLEGLGVAVQAVEFEVRLLEDITGGVNTCKSTKLVPAREG